MSVWVLRHWFAATTQLSILILDVVHICEAVWVLCTWPTMYSSHAPEMYVLKGLFRHTSRGWIILVQPPGITTCDMLFFARMAKMSSVRWSLKVSNTSKAWRPLVCCTRTFLIHVSISLWSIHPLGWVVTITLHSLVVIFFNMR